MATNKVMPALKFYALLLSLRIYFMIWKCFKVCHVSISMSITYAISRYMFTPVYLATELGRMLV